MTDIGGLGGQTSAARGVNNSGQVVGFSWTNGNVAQHAFLHSGGTNTDLGTFGGQDSAAFGINDNGIVVGQAQNSAGYYYAFSDSGGSMQDLGTPPGGLESTADCINDSGQIAGYFETGSTNHAFLYSDGVMEDLNNLIPANSGWTLQGATGINNADQICGYGTNPGGQSDAFLLTPTPEPSTLALLATGLAGLGTVYLRRQRSR